MLGLGMINFIAIVYVLLTIKDLKDASSYWRKKLQVFLGVNYNRKGKMR